MPFVLAITFLSDHIHLLTLSIVSLTILVTIICFCVRPTKPINIRQLLDLKVHYEKRLPFLTNLMSTLLHQVCVAIIAVDFPLFSRRFAKTEIYGWSLMDVGVGSFVTANAGFSPESRLGTEFGYSSMFLFKKTLLSTIPLIVLGFQRLIAVKSLDYYEHITEYGLHWNFFFTLALTKVNDQRVCHSSSIFQIPFDNNLFTFYNRLILVFLVIFDNILLSIHRQSQHWFVWIPFVSVLSDLSLLWFESIHPK